MRIGKLASASGLSRDTIRYYEKLGLIESVQASNQNNYKDYSSRTLDRLNHIHQLKGLGFTLAEIGDLLELTSTVPEPCQYLPEQLERKLAMLRRKIELLQGVEHKLAAVRRACTVGCGLSGGLPSCMDTTGCQ